MAADDRVVVQGDLIRFGLAQYDEMGKLRQEIVGATDATVADALEDGALTGVALDGAVAELMANPSALRTVTNSTTLALIADELPVALAADPTIVATAAAASEAAVDERVEGLDLVQRTDPAIPNIKQYYYKGELLLSLELDEAGHALRARGADGRDIFFRAQIAGGIVESVVDFLGVRWNAFLGTNPGERSELELDHNLDVPQWVLDRWKSRMGVATPGFAVTHVVVGAGQSNNTQADAALAVSSTPNPRLLKWNGTGIVVAPETETYLLPNAAREMLRDLPADHAVLYVPTAVGATSFRTSSITPTPTGYSAGTGSWDRTLAGEPNNLYAKMIAATTAATAALTALGRTWTLDAILFSGGEGDTPWLSQSAYAALLDDLITTARTDLASPNLPVVVSSMVPEYAYAAGQAHTLDVAAALSDTPRRLTRTAFVWGPAGNTQYGYPIHWSTAGALLRGPMFAEGLRRARVNVNPSQPGTPQNLTVRRSGTDVEATCAPALTRVTGITFEYSTDSGSTWTAMTLDTTSRLRATATVTAATPILVRTSVVNEVGSGPAVTVKA